MLAYDLYKISDGQRQMLENVAGSLYLWNPCSQYLTYSSLWPRSSTSSSFSATIAYFGARIFRQVYLHPTSSPLTRFVPPYVAQHATAISLDPSSPTSRQTHIVSPNTPSHWSASQRTNLGHDIEGDDSNSILSRPLYSPLKQGDFVDQGDGSEEAESEARRETPSGDRRELKAHEQVEDSALGELRSIAPNLTLPLTPNVPEVEHQRSHSPSPAPIRNPVVLVPDSDISGSHSQSRTYSQSLSLTQPSISQHSSQNRQGLISQKNVPESSYPQTLPIFPKPSAIEVRDAAQRQGNNTLDPKNNQLDTDDESAQRILLSANAEASHTPSHPRVITPQKPELVNLTCPVVAVAHPRMGSSTFNDLLGKADEQVSTLTTNSHAAEVDRGQKRKLAESSEVNVLGHEPATKRQRGSPTDEVVIESVGHEANAWKKPSFVHARSKATLKEGTTAHVNIDRALGVLFVWFLMPGDSKHYSYRFQG